MAKTTIYGIEFNVSDAVISLMSITKSDYKNKIIDIDNQIKELVDDKYNDHYILVGDNDELYIDAKWFKVYRKHYLIDTTDINLYKAVCSDEHTFKNGITITDIFNSLRK